MSELSSTEVIERVNALQHDFNVLREEALDRLNVYRMMKVPNLPKDLARNVQVNILSPEVRQAAHTIRSQLLTFPTEITCTPTERDPGGAVLDAHKRKADNVEKVDAIFWTRVNPNRRLDRATYWRQLVQPLAIWVFECGGIEKADPAQRFPWKVFDVDFATCGWMEQDTIPTHFGRAYRQTFAQAAQTFSRRRGTAYANKDLTMANGRLTWVPASDATNPRDQRQLFGASARGFQQMDLYHYDDGANIYTVGLNQGDRKYQIGPFHFGAMQAGQGEILSVVENPVGRCCAVLVPSNDTPLQGPEDRYEGFLDPLTATVEQINYIETMRATRSRNRAAPRDYVHMLPDVITQMIAKFGKLPDALEWSDTKTPYVAGEIKQRPIDDDQDLDKLEDRLERRLESYKPSGAATLSDPEVLKSSTAAAIISAVEANVQLLAPLIGSGDNARKQILEMFHESIKYYAKSGKQYAEFDLIAPESMTLKGKTVPSGTRAQANPDAFDFPFQLSVSTRSMTTAQREALHSIAISHMEPMPDGSPGTGTRQDVYDADGVTDVQAQEIQQAKERILAGQDAALQQMAALATQRKIFLITGMTIPLAGAQGAPGATPAPSGGGDTTGAGNHTTSPQTEPVAGGSEPQVTAA